MQHNSRPPPFSPPPPAASASLSSHSPNLSPPFSSSLAYLAHSLLSVFSFLLLSPFFYWYYSLVLTLNISFPEAHVSLLALHTITSIHQLSAYSSFATRLPSHYSVTITPTILITRVSLWPPSSMPHIPRVPGAAQHASSLPPLQATLTPDVPEVWVIVYMCGRVQEQKDWDGEGGWEGGHRWVMEAVGGCGSDRGGQLNGAQPSCLRLSLARQ